PAEARMEFEQIPPEEVGRLTGLAIVAARSGRMPEVEQTVATMRELFGTAARYQYAQVYAQAGDIDHAFAELNQAFEVRDPGLIGLKADPFLQPIRREPRYARLVSS